MSISHQIALWADKLRDLSASGLRYTSSSYDVERYQAIQSLSMEMLSVVTDRSVEHFEPLRSTVFSRTTPLSTGEGGVIDEDGRILLIRRADNKKWAMPGGALEVGETAAEGVVREVLEETGVRAQALALAGVFDSRRSGEAHLHHLYQFLFLCRPVGGMATATACSHAHEVIDVGWFSEDSLPTDLAPGHGYRIPIAFQVWHRGVPAYFDEKL